MKTLSGLVMALLAASIALLPEPTDPNPGSSPDFAPPPISVCALVEAGDQVTEVAVLSSVNGEGRISVFSSGTETGSEGFVTGGSGSTKISASELSVVGLAGGLVELPSVTTVAGVVVSGATSVAAEACSHQAPAQAFVSGGSTASGARFSLQLINPYAGPAVAELTVSSESGIESNTRFGAVTVPALSSITFDMAEIIPGRERISVEIQPIRGSVFGVGHQRTDSRSALWNAVEPQQDWWVAVPEGTEGRVLIISNPLNAAVEYQVDLYGPIEFTEEFESGSIPPRGEVRVPLDFETRDALGLRVISTSPVATTLGVDNHDGLSMTTGSPVDALTWLLPGAEAAPGGEGSVVIFNNGIDSVEASIRSLGGVSFNRSLSIDAGAVVSVPVVAADGFRVDASGSVVVVWASSPGAGHALAVGVPVLDG